MVDISRDIEWEQNFEFDQKIQSKVINQNDDDVDDQNSPSHSPATTDIELDDDHDKNKQNDDDAKIKKRARRPSNAELIDRVIAQKKFSFDTLSLPFIQPSIQITA